MTGVSSRGLRPEQATSSAQPPGAAGRAGSPPWATVAYAALFLVGFACLGAALATDGTPDFKIYHYYNGFAAHHDRSALDIFPAQMQTAYFPGLDRVYYSLFRALDDHPTALNVILSIPYALAALLVFSMARLFLPERARWRDPACAAVALLGVTGAGALPTMATTMSDLVPAVPLLAALAAWLWLERAGRTTVRSAFLIGAVAGLSIGLKMTLAPVFVGLFCVIALRAARGVRGAIVQAFALGLGGVLAYAAVDAPWLLHNLRAYGNPIFPLMNGVFRSDLVDHGAWTDLRFMPRTTLMALLYPAYWAFTPSHLAIELDMRDARVLVGCASALLVLGAYAIRRVRGGATPLTALDHLRLQVATLVLVAYALWEYVWSIYRYLAVVESLAGVVLLIALTTLLEHRVQKAWIVTALVAIVATTMATTRYPWWSRARRTGQVYSVRLPPIDPHAMVVLLDSYAYSYLIPAMPASVRVVGAHSNLVRPGSWGVLEQRIEQAIREHPGPLWGMEYPEAFPGVADGTLSHHHLERAGECTLVDTNIEERPIVHLCPLRRRT